MFVSWKPQQPLGPNCYLFIAVILVCLQWPLPKWQAMVDGQGLNLSGCHSSSYWTDDDNSLQLPWHSSTVLTICICPKSLQLYRQSQRECHSHQGPWNHCAWKDNKIEQKTLRVFCSILLSFHAPVSQRQGSGKSETVRKHDLSDQNCLTKGACLAMCIFTGKVRIISRHFHKLLFNLYIVWTIVQRPTSHSPVWQNTVPTKTIKSYYWTVIDITV